MACQCTNNKSLQITDSKRQLVWWEHITWIYKVCLGQKHSLVALHKTYELQMALKWMTSFPHFFQYIFDKVLLVWYSEKCGQCWASKQSTVLKSLHSEIGTRCSERHAEACRSLTFTVSLLLHPPWGRWVSQQPLRQIWNRPKQEQYPQTHTWCFLKKCWVGFVVFRLVDVVWTDGHTLRQISEIGINSFGKICMLHSKFDWGVFFLLFQRESAAESTKSSACLTLLLCGQSANHSQGFGLSILFKEEIPVCVQENLYAFYKQSITELPESIQTLHPYEAQFASVTKLSAALHLANL